MAKVDTKRAVAEALGEFEAEQAQEQYEREEAERQLQADLDWEAIQEWEMDRDHRALQLEEEPYHDDDVYPCGNRHEPGVPCPYSEGWLY